MIGNNWVTNIIPIKRRLAMDKRFFLEPQDPMQRRYESLRSYFVEEVLAEEVAKRFSYSAHTVYSLLKEYKKQASPKFFLELKRGPKDHRKETLKVKEIIIALRKRNYSIYEIEETLLRQGYEITPKTIHFILKEEGFAKLFRRTNAERLDALQERRQYPEESNVGEFARVKRSSTSFGGIFLFIPLIIELGLDKIFKKSHFYGSKQIPTINYMLSYLALKLLGKERLCHIDDFSFDYGLGIFAGLNVLPKSTAITQYSYRNRPSFVAEVLREFIEVMHKKEMIEGEHIGLDFHPIPHYGDESTLEKNWIPTRGKSMKSILSFIAQDIDTTYLCYTQGDILRSESKDEVLRFIEFYKDTTGGYPECLVFDSKLTTYRNLNELNQKKKPIKFITLRIKGKWLEKKISQIRAWQKVRIDNVKRKYRNLKVYSEEIELNGYDGNLRQLIITGTGREFPMVIITNDMESSLKVIITIYSYRWRIENNLQENVDFFNLNALSSPVVVKVNFDMGITLIANTLYKLLAKNMRRFEKSKPKRLFHNFVECPVEIKIDPRLVNIKFLNGPYNPLLMDWVRDKQDMPVHWMGNRKLRFKF
jgi:transposase